MYRILLVDDEPALLELTRIFLEQPGDLVVDLAPSPLQGLTMLAATPYDAIISDYEVPEMDGITFLREVRRLGVAIPFIIFSGCGREEVVIEALNSGADFYLQKGGNPSARFAELRNMVLQGIRRRQAEADVQRSRDMYQSIFEHTGSATIIIEGDMTISLANSEAVHLTGYTREEVEGKMPWTAFVAPVDLGRLAGYHRQRREDPGAAPRTYEFQMVDRVGRVKDIHMTIGSIPGTDRTVASMIDISGRKRFEEELRAAQEQMAAAFEEARASQESLAMQCREMEDYQATLRGIIDFLPDPTFALDRAGTVTTWNRAMEGVTGVQRSRIIGSSARAISGLISGSPYPLLAEAILSREGRPKRGDPSREIFIPSPGGGEGIYLWEKASPLYDAQGSLSGAIESLRDITGQKRIEAQIRRRVDLERMVSSISARFITLDPLDLETALEETLRALGSFLNVDRSYIIRFSADLTHVEDAHEWCAEGIKPQIDVLQNLPIDVIIWGLPQILAKETICIPDIAGLPAGSPVREFFEGYGVQSIILVPIATAGEALGIFGLETTLQVRAWSDDDTSLLEVTGNLFAGLFSRIRAHEHLQKSERRFRALIERSHDCYIRATELPPAIEYVSPSWERLTGYTREEFRADPGLIERSIHPDDRETLLTLLREPDADRVYTIRGLRKDGCYTWLEVCPIPTYANDGRLIAVDYTVHDINAWKQAEAALIEANKKLSLMNSIVRHDILNQITVVLGHIALLREQPLDAAVTAALDKQQVAAEIIQSQIEFTRDYQDLGARAPQWFSIEPLITAAAQALRPNGIRIATDLNGISIYADPLISAVFYNLLENTLRHGKTVTAIRATAVPDGGGARIIWEDDGIGIPAGDKGRIFERGFGSHTGLGLFLVREILVITGMGIRETGTPGKGACFEILVPEGCTRFGGRETAEK